jgi:MurNAc alpha-1-phosphate uridylyltransferase
VSHLSDLSEFRQTGPVHPDRCWEIILNRKSEMKLNTPLGNRGKAMILAAGLGTRLKPWTDKHPKALAVVNGESLLQRNIEYLQTFEICDVVVNVHHFADQIIEAIEKNNGWGSSVTISDETDAVLETGGALKKAAPFLQNETDFILMNVDVLTDLPLDKMIADHFANKPLVTLATTQRFTSRYFLFNANNELCGWRNVETGIDKISRPSAKYYQKAFSGIHVISNKIFSLMNQEGKFSMIDVYLETAKSEIITCYDHSDSKFIDVGKPENIRKAEAIFA